MSLATRFNPSNIPKPTYLNSQINSEKFSKPETPEDIAAMMEERNNNIGFVIGKLLRDVFDSVSDVIAKGWHWFTSPGKESIVKEDKVREFSHPEYPSLSKESQLCMLMNPHADRKYSSNINLFVNVLDGDKDFVQETVAKAGDAYSKHANLDVTFVTKEEQAEVNVGYIPLRLKWLSMGGWSIFPVPNWAMIGGWATLPAPIHSDEHKKDKFILEFNPLVINSALNSTFYSIAKHEVGHSFLDARHPFQSHEVNPISNAILSEFLDKPELTVMTYSQFGYDVYLADIVDWYFDPSMMYTFFGLHRQEDISYCDTVMAIEKYGQNRKQRNQTVYHTLLENTGKAFTLSNQDGAGVFDARHLTARASFVLGAGFEPTRIKGTLYYLGHKSDITTLYTTAFDDTIRLGPNYNVIHITGGLKKTIILQPGCVFSDIYGFRPSQDSFLVQGFKDLHTFDQIRIRQAKQGVIITLPEGGSIKFPDLTLADVKKIKVIFEKQMQDGIAYINRSTGSFVNTAIVLAMACAQIGIRLIVLLDLKEMICKIIKKDRKRAAKKIRREQRELEEMRCMNNFEEALLKNLEESHDFERIVEVVEVPVPDKLVSPLYALERQSNETDINEEPQSLELQKPDVSDVNLRYIIGLKKGI